MKNVLVFVLLVATLLPTVSQWGTIAYYHANRDYIARVLCENRDKPQLHCDGQCYLAKQLKAQQDKQDKETTERVQNSPVLQLFFEVSQQYSFGPVWTEAQSINFFEYTRSIALTPLMGFFRPPRF
ncbi:hypothetical protein [Spirosoma aureum]|uniref:hypothetical protein n=1 Tax=Spirosoma aureum TaxID=2692134 RepID=UPI001E63B039|nr:hypothetical protein [Spirosoma aureum]